ncbi:MAG TPA: winged helix-turn-helix domain-containing protein [Candidatus Acidoferrum sp.]
MERTTTNKLQIGDWLVNPASGEITRNGETARLEARSMRLLVCLAEHAGEVVSIDELLNQAWAGVIVSSDSVYQAVTSLRRQLGDDAKQPMYIETVPRLGYRMVAKVRPWVEPAESTNLLAEPSRAPDQGRTVFSARTASGGRIRAGLAVAGAVALCIALVAMSMLHGNVSGSNASAEAASQPEKSIAVVPFLDLTEGMVEETFADGMTEELIDKLGKIPELMVPSATASFYYKNKKIPVAELARKLHVIYLLDGSVRKAGARVRVAARLIRADNGYVIWTETYDRPFDDILMVQDDIAGKVTAALRKSIR